MAEEEGEEKSTTAKITAEPNLPNDVKYVLIFGGCGSLGSSIIENFKKKSNVTIVTVDYRRNEQAEHTIRMRDMPNDVETIHDELKFLKAGINWKFDVIVCVAGGFSQGDVSQGNLVEDFVKMYKYNLKPAMVAATVARDTLKEGGLLVLTGANAATEPTPGMISYGTSKAAVHHLVQSCASQGSGLPKNSKTVGVLPVCLDTKQNREERPNENFDNWTPPIDIAEQLYMWASSLDFSFKAESCPSSGSLVKVETSEGMTSFSILKPKK